MYYLLICLLLNVNIFVVFRLFDKWRISILQAITANYFVCLLTGCAFEGIWPWEVWGHILTAPWLGVAIFLGFLFIGTFFLMAFCTQKLGMTIGSVSTKMSMVIPVAVGLLIYPDAAQQMEFVNYIGMALSLLAIVLVSLPDKKAALGNQVGHSPGKSILLVLGLPVSIFVLSGLLDTVFNYANYAYLRVEEQAIFPIAIFSVALLTGISIIVFQAIVQKKAFSVRALGAGLVLGVPNYFSVYVLLLALSAFNNNGAFVFPILNIAVILLSNLISVLVFKERMFTTKILGMLLALLAIVLLTFQHIF